MVHVPTTTILGKLDIILLFMTRQKNRLHICLSMSYNDKDVYAARYMKYRGFRK